MEGSMEGEGTMKSEGLCMASSSEQSFDLGCAPKA